jgi:hypothetical protein
MISFCVCFFFFFFFFLVSVNGKIQNGYAELEARDTNAVCKTTCRPGAYKSVLGRVCCGIHSKDLVFLCK